MRGHLVGRGSFAVWLLVAVPDLPGSRPGCSLGPSGPGGTSAPFKAQRWSPAREPSPDAPRPSSAFPPCSSLLGGPTSL